MKKLIFFILLCLTFTKAQSQVFDTLCIVTEIAGWQASHDSAGTYGPVFLVDQMCTNECVIDCVCGTDYDSPQVDDHFDGCCDSVRTIWGSLPTSNCYFNPDTFWFRYRFNLAPCQRVVSAIAHIQADQEYILYFNGDGIDTTVTADDTWDNDFFFNLTDSLQAGTNEILIRVVNVNGGSCFNYAFLAFCMQVITTDIPLDASFGTSTTSFPNGNHSFTCTATETDPMFHHDWRVFEVDPVSGLLVLLTPPTCSDCGPTITLTGTGLPSGRCRNFVVFHRLYLLDTIPNPDTALCEATWRNTIQICNGKPAVIGKGGPSTWDGGHDGDGGDKGKSGGDRSKTSTGDVRSGIQLSPNPTQDLLNVRWADFSASQLKVINSSGQIVLEQNLTLTDASIDLQVGNLPSGIYILELRNQDSGDKLTQLFSVKK